MGEWDGMGCIGYIGHLGGQSIGDMVDLNSMLRRDEKEKSRCLWRGSSKFDLHAASSFSLRARCQTRTEGQGGAVEQPQHGIGSRF